MTEYTIKLYLCKNSTKYFNLTKPERVYNHQKWAVISGYLMRGKSKPQLGYSHYILSNGEKYLKIEDFMLQRAGKSEGKKKEDYHKSFQKHTEFRGKNTPNFIKRKTQAPQSVFILTQASTSSNLTML